jgi:hypothetical protein
MDINIYAGHNWILIEHFPSGGFDNILAKYHLHPASGASSVPLAGVLVVYGCLSAS